MTTTSHHAYGLSTADDVAEATTAAAREARERNPRPAAVLVLVTHNHGAGALDAARAAAREIFPGVAIAGGTVNGFIHEGRRLDAFMANDRAVTILALGDADRAPVAIVLGPDPSADPRAAGRSLGERAAKALGRPVAGGLVFSTGLSTGVHVHDGALVAGIDEALGTAGRATSAHAGLAGCGLCGGSDLHGNALPGRAFAGDEEHELGVLLVAFGESTNPRFAIANGVRKVKSVGRVTAATGPTIASIDGRPAKEVLLDALLPQGSPEERAQFEGSLLVACIESRTCLAVEDRQLGLLWPHVPVDVAGESFLDLFQAKEGDELLLAQTTADECMAAVRAAADQLAEQAPEAEYDLLLSFSCVMRGLILGERAGAENELMRVRRGQHLGIVANGEIGSYRRGAPASTGWAYSIAALGGGGRA